VLLPGGPGAGLLLLHLVLLLRMSWVAVMLQMERHQQHQQQQSSCLLLPGMAGTRQLMVRLAHLQHQQTEDGGQVVDSSLAYKCMTTSSKQELVTDLLQHLVPNTAAASQAPLPCVMVAWWPSATYVAYTNLMPCRQHPCCPC